MNHLDKIVEHFIRVNKKLKRWKRGVSALAAIVVFVTTYALILPALTLDVNTASTQAGIDIAESEPVVTESAEEVGPEEPQVEEQEEQEQNEDPAEASDDEETNTEDASNNDDAEPAVENDQDNTDEADDSHDVATSEESSEAVSTTENSESAATAKTEETVKLITGYRQLVYTYVDEAYEQDGNDDDHDDGYTVYADFGTSAKLPEGVELQVTEITKESDPDAYEEYYEKALSEMQDKYDENTGLSFAKFYDIAFIYDGKEIEPQGMVKVRIEYNEAVEVRKDINVDTVHFDKNNEEKPEVIDSQIDAKKQGEDEAMKSVKFESDQFSVYGVVGAGSLTTSFQSTDGNTYEVTVYCDEAAGVPLDAELKVREIEESADGYADYMADAEEVMGVSAGKIAYSKLLDITIEKDGVKIEPEAPVRVEIKLLDKDENTEGKSLNVVHFEGEDEEAKLVEEPQEQDDAVVFETNGFSVYGVFYTVDFEYSVNGKMYQFSLPGGGFVSFTDLVEVLGIIGDTNSEENGDENGAVITENGEENGINEGAEEGGIDSDTNTALTLGDVEVSEATRKFVANVANVEFSSPELVDVSKVENETTVGQIKESRGLEVEYSAELTEEQITEINAQTVEAGDWALISLKAFDTEEYMTVTMKTGEVFQINVTDDQENPLGLDGKSFAITASKNNNYYYLANDISSSNGNCLKAYTFNPNGGGTPQGSTWTFEWTGEGKKYLIHDNQNRYILIENDKVSLTNRDTALANPITVVSREGKYSFVNEKNNQALNIYGSSGFGRWPYAESNSDFLMTLQKPSDLKKPGTISTADTSGLLQINLFDYGPEDELDKEANNNSNPYSGGINSGHTLKFFSYGKNVGNGVNDFTGAGNGPQTGIVADQLSGNYPVLASNTSESLAYLFGGESNNYVTSYTGLNHLFTKDENGYYHYNSDQNYAYLDGSNFKVYSKTFPEEGADEQHFGVGFFPFNDYDEYYNCIHGKDGFERWDPHSNGTNPKKNGHYNHHFGMSLIGNFIMPPEGQYNGKDVTFQFSGDDDMWVYVDGVLIMDIGGVHNPVHGEINFTTGEVTVHGAAQENFKEKYKRITGNDWDDSAFSNHDFRVFYMERGGMYSNLEVTFNLPLTPEIPITIDIEKVEKDDTSVKLPGAVFTLRKIKDADPINGTYATEDGTSPRDSEPTAATTGMTSFDNLTNGYYELTEKTAPAGYVLTDEMATYFKVESGVVTWLVKGDGKPSTWTTKSGKGSGELVDFEAAVAEDTEQGTAAKNAKFVIENEPGAALPNTGGPGTRLFTILGSILILGAGVLLWRRRRLI